MWKIVAVVLVMGQTYHKEAGPFSTKAECVRALGEKIVYYKALAENYNLKYQYQARCVSTHMAPVRAP